MNPAIMKARLNTRGNGIRSSIKPGQRACAQSAPRASQGLSAQVSARTSKRKITKRWWLGKDFMGLSTMVYEKIDGKQG
jgi:hypothetical protein